MKETNSNIDVWSLISTLVISFIIISSFSSCYHTRYVPVKTSMTKDSVVSKKDSIRIIDKINITDSVRMKDSVVIIQSPEGKLVGYKEYHYSNSTKNTDKSSQIWKARFDSLVSVKNKVIEKPYPVIKYKTVTVNKLSFIQKVEVILGKILFIILCLGAGYFVVPKIIKLIK